MESTLVLAQQLSTVLASKYNLDYVEVYNSVCIEVSKYTIDKVQPMDNMDTHNKSYVDSFITYKRLKGDKSTTVYNCDLQLRRYLEVLDKDILKVTTMDIYTYHSKAQQKYSSNCMPMIDYIKRLYSYMHTQGYIDHDPIDANWYHFDELGIMNTGWYNDNGKWYYLCSSGVMIANAMVEGRYLLDKSGVWIK